MKNVIKYYYNLEINNIHQKNGIYNFNIGNNYYSLYELKKAYNLNYIYELSNQLNQNGMYTHQIILNNQNNIVTIINQNNYVLLKTYGKLNEIVTLEDIIKFNKTYIINKEKNNWYELWINKIDYLEYQINELKNKYPLIKESFNYFSGLAETGIELLMNIKIKTNTCICHDRIKKNYTLFDLYNPFNFVIDNNTRDVAEYFKEKLLYEDIYPKIEKYIKTLSKQELQMFFIRMLYPTFYFDTYEEIIENNKSEDKILDIVKNVDKYEKIIKKTYISIRNICPLPEIEWLIK